MSGGLGEISESPKPGVGIQRRGSKRRLSSRTRQRDGGEREKKTKNGDVDGRDRSLINGTTKDDVEMDPDEGGDSHSGSEPADNQHTFKDETKLKINSIPILPTLSSESLPNIGSIFIRRGGNPSSPINLDSTPIPTPFLRLSPEGMASSKSDIDQPYPSPTPWNAPNHSSSSESMSTPRINIPSRSTRHLSNSAPSRSSPPLSFNLSTGQPLVNPPLKTQAAFVGKLYTMLEDEEIAKTGLIHWSADGTVFTCPDPTEFSK
jgi:hypothetical protein